MTLAQLFLIHRYKVDSVHYLTPTDDNQRQTEGMKARGLFSVGRRRGRPDHRRRRGQAPGEGAARQRSGGAEGADREALAARTAMATGKKELLTVDDREVAVTNPDKLFFPRAGVTKLELVRYYLDGGRGRAARRAAAGRWR